MSDAEDFLAELMEAMAEPLPDLAGQSAQSLRCGFSIRTMSEHMRKHKHSPYSYDGYYERCKCGVLAGDKTDPATGLRYMSFDQWPDER